MAKRIRAAKHYQRRDDPVRRMVVRGRGPIRRDLKAAFVHFSELVPVKKIEDIIRNGRVNQIIDAIPIDHYREILKAPFDKIAELRFDAAAHGVRRINASFARAGRKVRFSKRDALNEMFDKALGDRFNFDRFTDDVQGAIRQAQDDLIAQLTNDVRDTIEQAVLTGVRQGQDVSEIASSIRDVISLTDTQASAVLNYRNMLDNLDPTALQRQLRNPNADAEVQSAIDNGEALAQQRVDDLTNDYIDNYLDFRAYTIAQTESVRAANEGLHDAYSQAIGRGALPADAVRREWQLGDSPCPICESIPDLNPDGVGVDEDFDSDDGPISDPPVHPNCMCSIDFITDLDKIPDDEENPEGWGEFDTAGAE